MVFSIKPLTATSSTSWTKVVCFWSRWRTSQESIKYLKNKWLNNTWNNDELFQQCLSHLLFLGLLPVIQEKQRCGQEKHAPQDDDEGTKHEGIAQAEEPPQRWRSVALLKGVGDLHPGVSGQTHKDNHTPNITNTTTHAHRDTNKRQERFYWK